MKVITLIVWLVISVGIVSAQSLKSDSPYPMRSGINRGTSDSLVGTHYWYFYAVPGSNRLTVRFLQPASLYGAQMNTALTVTLADEKRTWRVTKTVTGSKNAQEAVFIADKVGKRMKILVSIAPPNQNLIRMGGEYEIEANGSVEFGESASAEDPIVRTYESKVNDYGTLKFLADGSVQASDGSIGTWRLFDEANRVYVVVIDKFKFSVQYAPGYGLVRPDEPNTIVFQELRR